MTEVSGATLTATPGGTIGKWVLTAMLTLIAALGLGELAISLAWLAVDWGGAHWRERSTGQALTIGGVLLVLLTLALTATARSGVVVRAAAALAVAGLFIVGLSKVPHTLGGLKPSCVIVHWRQTELTPDALRAVGVGDAGGSLMDLLYSDDKWHHLRLADRRHLEVPRERIVALETCQERN
jgi:hypothetical protein